MIRLPGQERIRRTVGYGDKAPTTFGGRMVGLIWMFTSIILISGLTAAIASVLTVSRLESGINGPEDLPGVRVGTVGGTTSEAYLRSLGGVIVRACPTPREAVAAVASGDVRAAVYDEPLLLYLVNTEFQGDLRVLPRQLERQEYAIALRSGSPLRESVNRVLLRTIADDAWDETLFRYTGR